MAGVTEVDGLLAQLLAVHGREDTPGVALRRQETVLGLRQTLIDMTQRCSIIQTQPDNALTRFLFSGISQIGDHRADPLLTGERFLDKSIVKELQTSGYDGAYAKTVCYALCDESAKGIRELEALHNGRIQTDIVTCADKGKFQKRLTCKLASLRPFVVSNYHYKRLENLYAQHCKDDEDNTKFLRRLFCLLVRYETLGGPMYQCSCTRQAFDAMRTGFGVDYECFASPFNHNAERYCSAFADTDTFFGSRGSFFADFAGLEETGGSFYANPPFVEEVMRDMLETIQVMLAWETPVTFVVVIPYWTDEACHKWMMEQIAQGTAKHKVLQQGHVYIEGSQQKNTEDSPKEHIAQFQASLFLLQNEEAMKKATDTESKFSAICRQFETGRAARR